MGGHSGTGSGYLRMPVFRALVEKSIRTGKPTPEEISKDYALTTQGTLRIFNAVRRDLGLPIVHARGQFHDFRAIESLVQEFAASAEREINSLKSRVADLEKRLNIKRDHVENNAVKIAGLQHGER